MHGFPHVYTLKVWPLTSVAYFMLFLGFFVLRSKFLCKLSLKENAGYCVAQGTS